MISSSAILRGKILIVDNQEVNVLLLEQTLRGAGYVSVASTLEPTEVCELHRKNRYDLIVLDLQMPGMDGFQVMEELKKIETSGFLPVLVISAQPHHQLRALKSGAKDFISKPFDLDEVLIRVHSLLEARILHEADRRRVDEPAATPAGNSTPRTIAWIVAAIGGLWLIYRLWVVGLLLVVALILAGTFHPIVVSMEKHGLKRRTALILLIVALSMGAAVLAFLTVPPLIDQFTTIVHDLPGQRERLIGLLERHRLTTPLGHALNDVGLEQSFGRLEAFLIGHSSDAMLVVGYGLTAFFLSLYLLADGKRTQGALYAVVPRTHHMRLARIIHNLKTIVGGYMLGQLIISVACAAFTLLLLGLCGVRNALALALLAALMDLIPFIGGLLAVGATVLTALGRGPQTAIIVLIGMAVYQGFETKVLVPKIYGHALRLSPVTVTLALIVGATLLGVMGALLALPIAAALQMILQELGVEMPGDDSDVSTARARDLKTEAAYELMSAGSTAPDAGQIANELAHGLREADAWVAASQAKKKGAAPARRADRGIP